LDKHIPQGIKYRTAFPKRKQTALHTQGGLP